MIIYIALIPTFLSFIIKYVDEDVELPVMGLQYAAGSYLRKGDF